MEISSTGGMRTYTGHRPSQSGLRGTWCGNEACPTQTTTPSDTPSGSPSNRTPEEKQEIDRLKKQDREVRNHEAAHVAAGGHHVRGGASFSYETGPDGKRYASGGEVSIDTSPVRGDPEATVRKMQAVRRAALAPANPSGQDRAVAARASQQEAAARRKAAQEGDSSEKENPVKSNTSSSRESTAKRYAEASSYYEATAPGSGFGSGQINLIG